MLGKTVLAEFDLEKRDLLNNLAYLRGIGVYSARSAGATVFEPLAYQDERGNSHVLVPLHESHIAIHADYKKGILGLEVFTCRTIRATDILDTFKRHLPGNYRGWEIWFPRGEAYE